MRRLAGRLRDRAGEETGASAVLVAILVVVLFGMGAIVLDIGNLMWERRMLQNSADAGALAAAQAYALEEDGSDPLEVARDFAESNNPRGAHVADDDFVIDEGDSESPTQVTVVARTGSDESGDDLLPSFLSGVLGVDEYGSGARAVALIGIAGAGETLPLSISWCEWEEFVGDPDDPEFDGESTPIFKSDSSESDECHGPAGQDAPGGFGKLEVVDEESCIADIDADGWVAGSTGGDPPDCDYDAFHDLVGEEVLVPIFVDDNELTGNNFEYQIGGFGAFILDGFRFPGGNWEHWDDENPSHPACGPPDTCISGQFTEFVSLSDGLAQQEDLLDLGAMSVILAE